MKYLKDICENNRIEYLKNALIEWNGLTSDKKKYILYLKNTNKKYSNPNNSHLLYILGVSDDKPQGFVTRTGGAGLCDIDLDFEERYRYRIIEYIIEKYGHDRVAHIGTFGTMKARSAIKSVTKTLGHPYAVGDELSKLTLEPVSGKTPKLKESIEKVPELYKYRNGNSTHGEILKWAEKVEGMVSQLSVHASGVVISNDSLEEKVPLFKSKEGEMTTQWDMNNIEEIGLIKFDILGLDALTKIHNAVNIIKEKHNISIDIDNIDIEDDSTFAALRSGDNVGIFQLESSSGIRDMLVKIRPTKVEDLFSLIAIYRPGPLCLSGDTKVLANISYKKNEEHFKYITLKELYDVYKHKTIKNKVNNVQLLQSVKLDDLCLLSNKVKNIHQSGSKDVYKLNIQICLTEVKEKHQLYTANIKKRSSNIKATLDHKFLTIDGWKALGKIQPGEYIAIAYTDDSEYQKSDIYDIPNIAFKHYQHKCVLCENASEPLSVNRIEVDKLTYNSCENLVFLCTSHDREYKKGSIDKKLLISCREQYKLPVSNQIMYVKFLGLEYVGLENTFDIEMQSPYNNFIAGNFVVHNSSDYKETYLAVREGKCKPQYLVPELEPILKETEGWCIYQEQCCVKGEPIWLNNKVSKIENVRIGDLVSTEDGCHKVIKAGYTGKKESVKIRTSYGEFSVTKDHKVLTSSGEYIEAGNLIKDNLIPIAKINFQDNATYLASELRSAYELGASRGIEYINSNTTNTVRDSKKQSIYIILQSINLMKAFIVGLLDSNKSIDENRNSICITLKNKNTVSTLMWMCRVIGITAYQKENNVYLCNIIKLKDIYNNISIRKQINFDYWADQSINKEALVFDTKDFQKWVDNKFNSTDIFLQKTGFNKANLHTSFLTEQTFPSEHRTKLCEDLPRYAKVLSVKNIGIKEVYDLTVDAKHQFNVNGHVVHNCMRIAKDLCGYTGGEADELRKAIGKKKDKLMAKHEVKFKNGWAKNGLPKDKGDILYNQILKFSKYGFNRSHAVAYGMITYQTAWLKTHYPIEYMCAVMISESGNKDAIIKCLAECKRMEINVLAPDINDSHESFWITKGNKIRFGLAPIKNIGKSSQIILEERKTNGKFKDLRDFCERIDLGVVNRKKLESLIMSGSFDCFAKTRASLIKSVEDIWEYRKQIKSHESKLKTYKKRLINISDRLKDISDGKRSVSGAKLSPLKKPEEPQPPEWPTLSEIDEMPDENIQSNEHELLGFYITSHPLSSLVHSGVTANYNTIEDIKNLSQGILTTFAAVVTKSKEITTKKKKSKMAFLHLEDLTGSIEAVCFPSVYERYKQHFLEIKPLSITGKIEVTETKDGKVTKIIVNNVSPLNLNKEEMSQKINARINLKRVNEIIELLNIYTGDKHEVSIILEADDGTYFSMPSRRIGSYRGKFIRELTKLRNE